MISREQTFSEMMIKSLYPLANTRFNSPFQGKPTPLELSGLFLFSPTVHLKVLGLSMSGLFAEMERMSLYKRLDQAMKGIRPISLGLTDDLINQIITSSSPIKNVFIAAHNGDDSAKVAVDQLGFWEAFLMGACDVEKNLPPWNAHLLAIERASAVPQVLVNNGRFHESVQLLSNDSLMCKFLWSDAITIFKSVSNEAQLLPLRTSISLEVLLSYVAAWDADLGMSEAQLIDILPTQDMPGCNPQKLLFQWLKKKIGAKSINSILEDERACNLSIDAATLKRWSSGKSHPSHDHWEEMIAAFIDEPDYQRAWFRYWGAKYISLIGYLWQEVLQKAENLAGTTNDHSQLPWPYFPFGHTSIESWCQARYLYWYGYHKTNTV
jgi:hypothetical protein